MSTRTQDQASAGQVRISGSRSALLATVLFLPVALLLALVFELIAQPRSDRMLGVGAFLLLIAGVTVFSGLLMGWVWHSHGTDSVVGDSTGLQITSRRHGDRSLAWSDLAELGWFTAPRVDTGLVGRVAGKDRAIWLCNPFGFKVHRGTAQLRDLAEAHGVTWRADYQSVDLDPNLVRPSRPTRFLYGR